MAEVSSIVEFKGSVGDLCYYRLNGKKVVRRKSGPSKERILRDPSYTRLKENMSEFGASSHLAKIYRRAMKGDCERFGGSYISGRLTALFKKVCDKGEGRRGRRSFMFSKHGDSITGFEFNKQYYFDSIFCTSGFHLIETGNQPVLQFSGRVNSQKRNIPAEASHFKLKMCICTLSDHEYDFMRGSYFPIEPEQNGVRIYQESPFCELNTGDQTAVEFTCELGEFSKYHDRVSFVSACGIQFFQENGSSFYSLEAGKAMKILRVFSMH